VKVGEEQYANKADTYGLLLSVDRRDVINDDLGAITTVPRKLGRGSGLKINDVFWTIFLDNSGFFKTANKNYLTGTDTVLLIDGLTKAEVAFLNGQESPTIETAEADFSRLGIQMRGYHDFGVALQDPKGGVKAKGEA